MSTVFEGVSTYSYPGDPLSDEGVEGINARIAAELERRWPECAPWIAVPGGEASSDWSFLVNGNNYATPTEEQAAAAGETCASIVLEQETPASWWVGV